MSCFILQKVGVELGKAPICNHLAQNYKLVSFHHVIVRAGGHLLKLLTLCVPMLCSC